MLEPFIKAFEKILGYPLGAKITSYEDLTNALQKLSSLYPQRCRLIPYGSSVEERPLYLLVVTSEGNLHRLEEIREKTLKLTDPRSLSPEEAEAILRQIPSTLWVAGSIHGDEHSSTEAALAFAFGLVLAEDPSILEVLQKVVVLIDPCQNPDGRERSRHSYYSVAGPEPNPDPYSAEHNQPWPGGRYSHSLFDLNRDWIVLTHPETQARVRAFLHWCPQVFVDLHEMNHRSHYFFPPPAQPHNPLIWTGQKKWWEIFGSAIAQVFDEQGWDYFTAEKFDAFYPGYGGDWPGYLGTLGMTLEQAGIHGLQMDRPDDRQMSLQEGASHHIVATWAVLQTLARRREERLRDFYTFRREVLSRAREEGFYEFVVPAEPNNQADLEDLAYLLQHQGVEVYVLEKDFEHPACQKLTTPQQREPSTSTSGSIKQSSEPTLSSFSLPKGSLVIPLDQPLGLLARVLLEPQIPLDSSWVQRQVERQSHRLPLEFYDVTAWSLVLARNLFLLRTSSPLPKELFSSFKGRDAPSLSGESYGFLIPWDSFASVKALNFLVRQGVKVHFSQEAFQTSGRVFSPGTLVVKRYSNSPSLREVLQEVGQWVEVVSVTSARTQEGIDLGSDKVTYFRPPRVALLYGEPTHPTSCGWALWYLEHRGHWKAGNESLEKFPLSAFTPLRWNTLLEADLFRYEVLILPDGAPSLYQKFLGQDFFQKVDPWLKRGGVLIAIGGASVFCSQSDLSWTTSRFLSDLREAQRGLQEEERGKEAKAAKVIPPEYRPAKVPGAVLRVRLDPNSPASYGLPEEIPVMVTSDRVLTPSVEGRNVGLYASEGELLTAGFIWDSMKAALAGKAYLVEEAVGKGRVFLFAEDPNFRGYWDITARLFFNALLFTPSLVQGGG